MLRRSLAVLPLAALVTLAVPTTLVSAAPTVTVTPDSAVAAPGATAPVAFFVTVPTGTPPLLSASLAVQLDPLLTYVGSPTVDGNPAAATRTGQTVTVTLPAPVTVSDHQVSFVARLSHAASRDAHSTGVLTYSDGTTHTQPATGPAVTTADLQDVSVEPLLASSVILKGDNPGGVNFTVADQRSNSSGAVLTLTPSDGFTIASTPVTGNDNSPLVCTRSGVSVTCTLSRTSLHGRTVDVGAVVRAAASATTGSVTATVRPLDGTTDGKTANNAAAVSLRHTGTADLKVLFDRTDASILPNGSVTYRVTVRNDGPDAATDVQGRLVLLFNDRFSAVYAGQGVSSASGANFATWHIGTLAVGAQVTATATVSGSVVGSYATFEVGLDSSSDDPGHCVTRSCDAQGSRRVTVVSSLPQAAGSGTGTSGLADTGSPTTPLGVLGLVLLAAGALAQFAGRRRVT